MDFSPGAPPKIEPVSIPCFRTLVSIKGDLDAIARSLQGLSAKTEDSDPDARIWLEAEVSGDDFLNDLTERVQAMVAEAGLDRAELLRVRRRRRGAGQGMIPREAERLEDLNPEEVFQRRLALEELDPERMSRLTELFGQILAQVTDPSAKAVHSEKMIQGQGQRGDML